MFSLVLVTCLIFLYFLVSIPFFMGDKVDTPFVIYLVSLIAIVSSLVYITDEWELCGFLFLCLGYHTFYTAVYSGKQLRRLLL